MNERIYTINELKQLISESAADFKPRVGSGVESSNKKESKAAYDAAKDKNKKLGGTGVETKPKKSTYKKTDDNKTMADLHPENELSKKHQDTIEAQGKGYTSPLEEKNGSEKIADFENNEVIQNAFVKNAKERNEAEESVKRSGLTAQHAPKDTFKKHTLYGESKKIAVLNFKNTTFLNESQMISRIPDDYKVDGKRFKVKDAGENEFIVEWVEGEASILSYENKKKLNESIEKFHKLSGYNSKSQFKTSSAQSRLNESNEFDTILNKARELAETKN
jgi:hypothetical protein